MPIEELYKFFTNIELSENDRNIAKRLLKEIISRLEYLVNVGLGYLTLDRASNTLSGGESQRISLATSLGSSLVGALYILDEPSIGLHSRDTDRLIKVLRKLQKLGNTVVVVEHDEEIIREADYIIDVGPEAGRNGGEIVYAGDMSNLKKAQTVTRCAICLAKKKWKFPVRAAPGTTIEIQGARENNLKNINVKFP